MLEARGLRLLHSRSLMACCPSDQPKAVWLQDFLRSYAPTLASAGLWSSSEQAELDVEIHQAQVHPSLWVTPALVEMIWEQQFLIWPLQLSVAGFFTGLFVGFGVGVVNACSIVKVIGCEEIACVSDESS